MFAQLARIVFRRRNAYRGVFLNPDGQVGVASNIVLADLKKFCRADRSTIQVSHLQQRVDPIASALLEGRREVWLRIMHHLNVSDKDLFAINDPDGQPTNQEGDDN